MKRKKLNLVAALRKLPSSEKWLHLTEEEKYELKKIKLDYLYNLQLGLNPKCKITLHFVDEIWNKWKFSTQSFVNDNSKLLISDMEKLVLVIKEHLGWQLIDTAPKNTMILGYSKDKCAPRGANIRETIWIVDSQRKAGGRWKADDSWQPTHWMPIPKGL